MKLDDLTWDTKSNEWWKIAKVGRLTIFKCQQVYRGGPGQDNSGPSYIDKFLVRNDSIPVDYSDDRKRWMIDPDPLLVQCLVYNELNEMNNLGGNDETYQNGVQPMR